MFRSPGCAVQPRPWRHVPLLGRALLAAFALLPLASPAQSLTGTGPFIANTTLGFTPVSGITPGEPRVNWLNGEYQETNTDLSVTALGGRVDIARSWIQGRWWLNPAWAPLNFELDPLGRDARVIERAGVLYERSGQSGLYIAARKGSASVYIKQTRDVSSQSVGCRLMKFVVTYLHS